MQEKYIPYIILVYLYSATITSFEMEFFDPLAGFLMTEIQVLPTFKHAVLGQFQTRSPLSVKGGKTENHARVYYLVVNE